MTDFSGLDHSNVVIAWLEVNKQQQLLWLLLRRTQSLSQVVQNLLADKLFGNIRFRGGFPYSNAKRFTQIAELDQKLEQFDYCTTAVSVEFLIDVECDLTSSTLFLPLSSKLEIYFLQ